MLSTLILLASSTLYANNIPIEMLGLTQKGSNVTGTSSSNLNWQLMQKNQELENDVRRLRGVLEEQDNEISKLKNELTNRYTDLDQRLELLYQKVDPEYVSINETTPQATTTTTTTTEVKATTNNPQTPVAIAASAETKSLPSYNVHNLNSNQNQTADAAKTAYNAVLEILRTDGPKSAITPMIDFIKQYPDSVYTSSAYFGIAEFLFSAPSNPSEAKKYFETVVNKFPNSTRAPRALARLYEIALNVEKNPTQAEQYKSTLLKNYATSEEAMSLSKITP